jgi:hypothetical protein
MCGVGVRARNSRQRPAWRIFRTPARGCVADQVFVYVCVVRQFVLRLRSHGPKRRADQTTTGRANRSARAGARSGML